jgi:hypothetical protein
VILRPNLLTAENAMPFDRRISFRSGMRLFPQTQVLKSKQHEIGGA